MVMCDQFAGALQGRVCTTLVSRSHNGLPPQGSAEAMKGVSTLAGLAVGLCCSCSDPSGPRPGLNLVQGGNASDTVGTRLQAPLTVAVLDSHRDPVPGVTVYFGTGGTGP